MIHRVIYGSIERFIGILTEHFAGAFPTWLAPVQARVLPITERQHEYARQVAAELEANDIRVDSDFRSERIGYKIREGQLQKIPYLIILGDKEVEAATVAVRHRKQGDLGAISLAEFTGKIKKEIEEKAL